MLEKYHSVEQIDHVHHAGNSSGIVDDAALVLVGDAVTGEQLGLKPRARIVATAVSGADPTIMLTGPTPAVRKALAVAEIEPSDVDLWEINEACAAVPMNVMAELDIPHERVNVNEGAIAMGHPLGTTGAMLVCTLVDELHRQNKRYGIVTLCVGGGMGIATVIEKIGGNAMNASTTPAVRSEKDIADGGVRCIVA